VDGGHVPLGYRIEGGKLVVDEAEAAAVRLIYERYLALGSLTPLLSELRQQGIVTKQRPLANGTVRGGIAFTRGPLGYGGVVIISELLADYDKTGPAPAALMSLSMLIETEGGRNYTAGEYSAWLDEAGFRDIQTVRFDAAGANGVVFARKPCKERVRHGSQDLDQGWRGGSGPTTPSEDKDCDPISTASTGPERAPLH
jgi:hypothetical protein